MSFGMFGAIFLLTQFLQTAQGYSPLQAGLRVLPWTAMPLLVAPIAGALSDRIGGRSLMATGVALQAVSLAWLASVASANVPYAELIGPFVMAGVGMGMFFAPVANVVLGSVALHEEGQASGANNAIRELGGVFGVAVLASIFTHYGSYQTPHTFVHGLTPALYIGAIIVGFGAVAALFIARRRPAPARAPVQRAAGAVVPELSLETA
jgi:MFS family permease